MCDEDTLADLDAMEALDRHAPQSPQLTRREFGTLAAGAGLSVLLPEAAGADEAVEVRAADVTVTTPDGTADAYFAHPAIGRHPGVLMWPDAFGLRPAKKRMARRLAGAGYSVLVVNPYYRVGPAPVLPAGADFADPATRDKIMRLIASLTPEVQTSDANAFIDFLDAQPAVDTKRKIGTMGYCMGGPMTMRTAAARPNRVAAGASFHGGRLVTDSADSPHLLVAKINAHYLFAIAENDDERDPAAKRVLRETFARRGLPAEIEVYEGALHGWCPPDSRAYNEAQAERAWSRLLVLFEEALA